MSGRLVAGVAAFAIAAAFVVHGGTLPEFFVQLRDPNLTGGPLFVWLANSFGSAFVLALCAVLTGGAVMLVAARTQNRGSTSRYAALAALLAALGFSGRLGISLDPIGWVCAAAFCLFLEKEDARSAIAAIAIAIVWALAQGGATLGAVLAILFAAGAWIDARRFHSTVRLRWIVAAACTVIAIVRWHGPILQAYGAHALYLDSLLHGAQRDRIFTANFSAQAAGFLAIVIVAAWYGIRRRGKAADTLGFFTLFSLALIDARNLPYFAIVAAPIVADSAGAFALFARPMQVAAWRIYALSFAAAACVLVAFTVALMPKVTTFQASSSSLAIAAPLRMAAEPLVLCVQPRWCDELAPSLASVLDDRAGVSSSALRRLQYDVASASGKWASELRTSGVGAILTGPDDALVSLLPAHGWRKAGSAGGRVVFVR